MKIHLRYGFQHFSTPIPQDCGKPVENPYIASLIDVARNECSLYNLSYGIGIWNRKSAN